MPTFSQSNDDSFCGVKYLELFLNATVDKVQTIIEMFPNQDAIQIIMVLTHVAI